MTRTAHAALIMALAALVISVPSCRSPGALRLTYEVRVTGPTGGYAAVETCDYIGSQRRFLQRGRTTLLNYESERYSWWYEDGKFLHTQPIPEYTLAQYLARHEVITNDGFARSVREKTHEKRYAQLRRLVESVAALIQFFRDREPGRLDVVAERLPELLDSYGWGPAQEDVRAFLDIHVQMDRAESGGRGLYVLKVLGPRDMLLRTLLVRRIGRARVLDSRLRQIVRLVQAPDRSDTDLTAWHAMLGDGYVIVEDWDDGLYRRAKATGPPARLDPKLKLAINPPDGKVLCDNRGRIDVEKWGDLLWDGEKRPVVLVNDNAPHVLTGSLTVCCKDGSRAGYLLTRVMAADDRELRSGRVERRVELLSGEPLRIPLEVALSDTDLPPQGQFRLAVTLDGERTAESPADMRLDFEVAGKLVTPIGQIRSDPGYAGKTVTVAGEVTGFFSLGALKFFTIRDSTGAIRVMTSGTLPRKGMIKRVRGTVRQFTIGPVVETILEERTR